MIGLPRGLLRSERGASAVEFALVAPIFIAMMLGILQLGMVFLANAGLNNALAEGARFASLYPRPSEAQIRERIAATQFGLEPSRLAIERYDYDPAAAPAHTTITMRYAVHLNFIFFETQPFFLRQTRRVYMQPERPS